MSAECQGECLTGSAQRGRAWVGMCELGASDWACLTWAHRCLLDGHKDATRDPPQHPGGGISSERVGRQPAAALLVGTPGSESPGANHRAPSPAFGTQHRGTHLPWVLGMLNQTHQTRSLRGTLSTQGQPWVQGEHGGCPPGWRLRPQVPALPPREPWEDLAGSWGRWRAGRGQ